MGHEPDQNGDQITVGSIANSIGVAIGRGAQAIVKVVVPNLDELTAQRDRAAMLAMVKKFWIQGVLEQSLYNETLIPLTLVEQPDAVKNNAWATLIQTPSQPPESASPPPSVVDAFYALNELTRTLLILGAPGSGKTTALLDLAREAIARAEQDATLPIPVIFNLASWAVKRQAMAAWLVNEFNDKYYVARTVSQPWVEKNKLLLLLDGLDEVAAEYQNECIVALNVLRAEHNMPIVVCCRVEEYATLPVQLQFQRAILLQPLTLSQLEQQLRRATGAEFSTLTAILQRDNALQEMAQNPLMLNTMLRAFHGAPAQWQMLGATDSPRRFVFDIYVQRVFLQHGSPQQRYPQKQTLQWLRWLAQEMDQHAQAVFLIERMQPSWLTSLVDRWGYVLGTRFVYGGVVGLICAALLLLSNGLILGINLFIPKHELWDYAIWLFRLWLQIGIVLGCVEGVLWAYEPTQAHRLWRLAKTVLYGWIIGEIFAHGWGLFYAVFFGVMGSVFLVVGSGAPVVAQEIRAVEKLQFSWQGALRGVLLGFGAGIIVGGILDQIVGGRFFNWLLPKLSLPLGRFVAAGLLFGPVLAMFGIIFGGFHGVFLDTQTRPNQGIIFSVRNALIAGFICLLLGWGVGFAYALIGQQVVPVGWTQLRTGGPWHGLSVGLLFGAFAMLWHGGLDVIKHFILRLLLWRAGYMPWNYAHFLDYAAERIFLRKVGGGYIFIHRLLLEYFARLELP